MPLIQTEAVTLRRRRTREADALITCYCRTGGKIMASTRSVLKTTSRYAGVTQPFNHLHVMFYEKVEGQEIKTLTQVSLIESFDRLRSDVERMSYASCLAEWIDILSSHTETNPLIWNLLLQAYRRWNRQSPVPEDLIYYQWNLLIDAGICPGIEACPQCHATESTLWFYQAKTGAIFCERCAQEGLIVHHDSIRVLRRMAQFTEPPAMQFTEQQIGEINRLLNHHLIYHLDIQPRATLFLRHWQILHEHPETRSPEKGT